MGEKVYQNILFDLDGTLTDPAEGICKSVQFALHRMGIEEADLGRLTPFIGPPLIDSFMEFYGMSEEEAKEAVAAYRERFSTLGIFENKVYKGIPELLQALKQKGRHLAIASSKPTVFVERILTHFHLREYFDVVVGSELDGTRTKKAEVIEETLGQLRQSKDASLENTVMIGDRSFDVEGGKEFSLDVIGVAYGYGGRQELKEAGADYVVDTVAQLGELLLGSTGHNLGAEKRKLPPKNSFFRALYVISPLFLYYIFQGIVRTLWQQIGGYLSVNEQSMTQLLVLMGVSMLLAGIGLYFTYKSTDPLPVQWKKELWLVLLLGIGAAIFLNHLLLDLFEAVPWGEKFLVQSNQRSTYLPYLGGLAIYGLVSPVSEELVFRWLMFGRMREIYHPNLVIIVSALFFGLYHGNLLQGIYAFLMGLLLAVVYEWSKNLLAPIALHMGANIIVFTVDYLPEPVKNLFNSGWIMWAGLALGAICMVTFYRKTKTSFA